MLRLAPLAAWSVCLSIPQAQADFAGEVALLSDYRFRGVTYSDGRPSLQATLDWSGASGLFAGAVASTVRLGRTDPVSGVGVQGYVGFGGSLTPRFAWSGGVTAYLYPSTSRGSNDYQEIFLRAGSDRWQTGLYWSPDYYGNGGQSVYWSISASHPIGDAFRVFASAGWFVAGHPFNAVPGDDRPQRFDGRLGVAWDFRYAIAEASVVGATSDNDRCRANPDGCQPTLVVALRKAF